MRDRFFASQILWDLARLQTEREGDKLERLLCTIVFVLRHAPTRKSVKSNPDRAIQVVISYSWDNESHKDWVRDFAMGLNGSRTGFTIDT